MTEISAADANAIVTWLALGTQPPAEARWLALCTTGYTEAAGAGYARINMSTLMGTPASGGQIASSAVAVFTNLNAGTYTQWVIAKASSGALTTYSTRGSLVTPATITAGGEVRVPVSQLVGSATGAP